MTHGLEDSAFPAKLLLFGEHVLLLGAPALAVPVPAFSGQWAWSKDFDRHHSRLLQFAESEALATLEVLNAGQFKKDLESGLYFQSNIPTGYGLGSSGALCAAIFARYAKEKGQDLAELKAIFASMESFFHGNSSGIDPLTSYVGEPILIQEKSKVQKARFPDWPQEHPLVFLLDTRLPRRSGPLVEWFLNQSKQPDFEHALRETYLPAHADTLHAWLSGNADLFWPNLRRVSEFQFKMFKPMIPETVTGLWKESLEASDITLKICGAGGGGFVLGFAKNKGAVDAWTSSYSIVFPDL